MSASEQGLTAAGVRDAGLRADFSARRRVLRRFRTSSPAARPLPPRPVRHRVVAAPARTPHGDDLLDTGPRPRRAAAWASWGTGARDGPPPLG
ncbi:hypothetical protein [Streptomyces tropicalis]|uniref:Uncharacterized protein n=1 Tax=Streptomyces tropicalis TaxID=3034234 RepID=A0ABT6A6N0_9ACTN|nr:hypothetical protein [Streptomyces tropicalis]MDF3300293.1 hypothetical protein [Streptomyces tropicalis]